MADTSNADFRGWATKAGLKCSDGRTIQPNAFQEQDGARVPLVWQHGHNDPENVLGHAILENREDGVYAYAFFNDTPKAEHARALVEHKDINSLSIWANQLIERGGHVLHGAIRELSLVLSGANPGAKIEHVTIRHSDDDEDFVLDDEAIIFTGLPLEHADTNTSTEKDENMASDSEKTVKDIYDSMTEEQKEVLHFMVGEALEAAKSGELSQSDLDSDEASDIEAIYASMTEEQQDVLHYLVGEALEASEAESDEDIEHSNDDEGTLSHDDIQEGNNSMKHNVFESESAGSPAATLSHEDVRGIIADATKRGSLKDAVEDYALAHGITDIDQLFPDAQLVNGGAPQLEARRTEWVQKLLGGVRKSPFSRIKTTAADITHEDARAKGYVKGNLKKEEFFSVSKRTTTPTTIYKKQKLDRDDVIDITDFDVISWLKAEMRVMLDEEIARAILVGDGRDVAHDDKINEGNIRPIATDHELFVTQVNVNIDDAESTVEEVIDAVITNRKFYKGSGIPTFFTSETYIAQFLLLKDGMGRRLYSSLNDIAMDLRVKEIVPVEVLEEYPDIVGVIVNPADYTIGADSGGQVTMFDDFDIDYNNHKYLIETRISGALTRLKSAIVLNKVAAAVTLVTPEAPTFNTITGVVTIPNQTGVIYKNVDGDGTLTPGAQAALSSGESLGVYAVADTNYAFNTNEDDEWLFVMD